jgi:hypothetical protein
MRLSILEVGGVKMFTISLGIKIGSEDCLKKYPFCEKRIIKEHKP